MSSPHPRNKARRGSYDGILHNKNTLHKSLAQRRCSAPSLVFPKTLSKPWSTGRENTGCSISIEQCPFVLGLSHEDSELILHECVQLTQDLKTKERYIFLFSDMIIIAKLKSGTSFRLKYRVDLSDMMVLSCDEEDEEDACPLHSSPKNALILIWPYNGCIASFRSCEVKELWLDTLVWQIREVGGIEGSTVPCTRLLMKVLTGCNASKALVASNMENLIECHTEAEAKKYQLLADMISEDGICHVIETNKKRKAVISWPFTFRRSSTMSEPSSTPELKATLFDQPLSIVCEEDNLPKAILDILTILRMQGPLTEGVFRKAANEKARKELKEDLNYGKDLDLKSKSVHLLAVVFKDFLRGIPRQLLSSELYSSWMFALEKPTLHERIKEMQSVAEKLPKPNLILLQHLMCVLHHISQASDITKMDSRNLAVCIAPNMLVSDIDKDLPLEMQKEHNEKVTMLTEFFIDNCLQLFGENISQLICVSEEDSIENMNAADLSSHQNDSAYDSTDPDHDWQANTLTERYEEQWGHNRAAAEKSQDIYFSDFTISRLKHEANSMDRRCSEPYIFPSQNDLKTAGQTLTRSHDDVTVRKHRLSGTELLTHTPQKYYDRALYRKHMPKGLTINTNYVSDIEDSLLPAASSNCSLDSSCSDGSVFTSSPLVSPSSPKKSGLLRHKSFSIKNKDVSDTVKTVKEIKKHSNSFCYANNKQMLTKTQSWGPNSDSDELQQKEFIRSFRNLSLKEGTGTRDTTFKQPSVVRMRRPQSTRKISVDEVFRMVDQRNPGKPPSYEEAVNTNMSSHKSMTVHLMKAGGSKHSCVTSQMINGPAADFSKPYDDPQLCIDMQKQDSRGFSQAYSPPEKEKMGLVRTKSESYSRNRHECISRRCSQPVFEIYEQIQYAKESYV